MRNAELSGRFLSSLRTPHSAFRTLMSDLLKAIILGVIEGLTEFLPVSSTGHMILAMPLLDIDSQLPPWKSFLYFIQIGAILAVIVYFWRRLWPQVTRRPEGTAIRVALAINQ